MSLSTNSTLLRAIALMEEVIKGEGTLTAAELGKRLDITKPTAHRLLGQLEQEGLIRRDLSGRHLIPGPRLKRMAFGALSNPSVNASIRAVLKRLSERVGETCNLTVRDEHEVIYFDRIETNWPVRVQLAPGSRLPLHCTSSGKLFLATMPPKQRQGLIDSLTLAPYTPHTLVTPEALEESLKHIERERVSTDNEEFIEGMVAVAVPIHDPSNRVLACLAIHAPCMRQPLEKLLELVPIMRESAREMEKVLEE
ncbi:IclR family transcriptional regulator [Pistricoccus aurantiacus]|uniref:HTH-type transcriptional repressor AllR n=1 Tax=Pistricoccus aurantiacus TaxID=1883414 RepID=A0A5B8SN93_9GAMM|nr:IclR family transcriptional regulator [Pistricoccus aurantiacus]QEA37731.1 IclR family transcriptional regulator [Pistricoccus aurantiacus]